MSRDWMTAPALAVLLAAACNRGEAPPASKPAPAKVTAAVPESALTTITLSEEARKRLGIETAPIERRTIARTRSLGGEVIPAGGAQITVTAPVAGTLGGGARVASVGSQVAKGQVVLTLVPLAPAERDVRIEAERAVREAEGRQEMAAKRAERARQLVRDGSGSQRAAEEAQAELVAAGCRAEGRERAPGAGGTNRECLGRHPAGGAARGGPADAARDAGSDA